MMEGSFGMNWNDIRPGVEVYHSLFTHWGKGIVQKVVSVNCLEGLFEGGSRRIIVQFDGHDSPSRMQLRELQKRPNRRKIKEMVYFYRRRGLEAKDGGDRLILSPDCQFTPRKAPT